MTPPTGLCLDRLPEPEEKVIKCLRNMLLNCFKRFDASCFSCTIQKVLARQCQELLESTFVTKMLEGFL